MKGRIVNYRRGRRTQKTNQMIIIPEGVKKREDAEKLLGKKVEWTTPSLSKEENGGKKKKIITGKVTRVHGAKGAIVARFEKGLPGQALGTEIEIIEK